MSLLKACLCISACLLISTGSYAESVYITDELKAGLHEEKTLESPIVKTLPTGTQLELIKREEKFSFVRDTDGATGWIDNSYLKQISPTNAQMQPLKDKNATLEKQLAETKQKLEQINAKLSGQANAGQATTVFEALTKQHASLQQQFKSERIKVGELQVQLAELRKRIGQDNDNASLYQQIAQLQRDKKNLQVQLADALDNDQLLSPVSASNPVSDEQHQNKPGWRDLLIYLAIAVIIGLAAGIYLMDYLNRRRHGGFRI